MRNYGYSRRTITLGTGLTALFLFVRCTVAERDYSRLGFGDDGGSAGGSSGTGGSSGDGAGGSSVAQGGSSGSSGSGGQGGGMPIEPVPCDPVSTDAGDDAGSTDAGSTDAGSDAGSGDAGDAGSAPACECVDGFLRAVDADGDGEGTRACSAAPGLDCDDGDNTVTHNACGGCSELPNQVGENCLDCGAYECGGPDTLVCISKPDPLVDPDCRCADGVVVARDTDGDRAGTRLCEQNPGTDCNDGDATFVQNACGGCDPLPGTVGSDCNECGTYACVGNALACVPKTGSAGRQCLNLTTRQTCGGTGFWGSNSTCSNVCYQGNCELCTPGAFRCVAFSNDFLLQRCGNVSTGSSSSSTTIGWGSYDSCIGAETCNAAQGRCVGYLLLPRDLNFDVPPVLKPGGLPWHDVLNTASDSDYG